MSTYVLWLKIKLNLLFNKLFIYLSIPIRRLPPTIILLKVTPNEIKSSLFSHRLLSYLQKNYSALHSFSLGFALVLDSGICLSIGYRICSTLGPESSPIPFFIPLRPFAHPGHDHRISCILYNWLIRGRLLVLWMEGNKGALCPSGAIVRIIIGLGRGRAIKDVRYMDVLSLMLISCIVWFAVGNSFVLRVPKLILLTCKWCWGPEAVPLPSFPVLTGFRMADTPLFGRSCCSLT